MPEGNSGCWRLRAVPEIYLQRRGIVRRAIVKSVGFDAAVFTNAAWRVGSYYYQLLGIDAVQVFRLPANSFDTEFVSLDDVLCFRSSAVTYRLSLKKFSKCFLYGM